MDDQTKERRRQLAAARQIIQQAQDSGQVDPESVAAVSEWVEQQVVLLESADADAGQLAFDFSGLAEKEDVAPQAPAPPPELVAPPEQSIPAESTEPEPAEQPAPAAAPYRAPAPAEYDTPNAPSPEPSVWSDTIRPVLADNWLLLVGAFLVVASGAYLLSVVWGELSGFGRRGVSFAILMVLGAGFSEAGRYLDRQQQLKRAYRALWTVGVGFTGLAAPLAGFMASDRPIFGVAGIVIVVAASFGLAGVRHPDGGGRRAPPTAIATATLALLASLAALGDGSGVAWMLGLSYAGGFVLWLAIYLNPADPADSTDKQAIEPNSTDSSAHTRDILIRLGHVFIHLGPPVYLFVVLLGVSGTRFWLADPVGEHWAWFGGLAGMVGLAVVEFSRRHLGASRFGHLLAGVFALLGILIGLGDALAVAAASAVSAGVFWRIPDDSRTRHILSYASYLVGYCALAIATLGDLATPQSPTASLVYLPLLGLMALRHWRLDPADTEATINTWFAGAGAWVVVIWALGDAPSLYWPLAICGAVGVGVQALYFVGRPSKGPGYSAVALAVLSAAGVAGMGVSTSDSTLFNSLAMALMGAAGVGGLLIGSIAVVERIASATSFVNTKTESLPGRFGDVATDMSVLIGAALALASVALLASFSGAGVLSPPHISRFAIALAGLNAAYAAGLLWQAHRTGSTPLGYSAFGAFALFGGACGYLIKKTFLPGSHGWGLAVAAAAILGLYEVYLRIPGNARRPSRRARLFEARVDKPLSEYWTSLCRRYAHIAAFGLLAIVFVSRAPDLMPRLISAALLIGVGLRAVCRRPRHPLSYFLCVGALQTICWTWVDWQNPNHLVIAGLAGAFVGQGCIYMARRSAPFKVLGFVSYVPNSLLAITLLVAAAMPLGWSNPVTFLQALPWAVLALVVFALDQTQQAGRYSAWAGAIFVSLFGILHAPDLITPLLISVNDALGGPSLLADLAAWSARAGSALGFLWAWLIVDFGLSRRAKSADSGERRALYQKISSAAITAFSILSVLLLWVLSAAYLTPKPNAILPAMVGMTSLILFVAIYTHTKTARAYLATLCVLLIYPAFIKGFGDLPSLAQGAHGYESAVSWGITALVIGLLFHRTRGLRDPYERSDEPDEHAEAASTWSIFSTWMTRRNRKPWPEVLDAQRGLWRGSVRFFALISVFKACFMAPANAAPIMALAATSLVFVGARPLRAYFDLLGALAAAILALASTLLALSEWVRPSLEFTYAFNAPAIALSTALAALLLPQARRYLEKPDIAENQPPPIEIIELGLMGVATLFALFGFTVDGANEFDTIWFGQRPCDLMSFGLLAFLWVRRTLRGHRTWAGYAALASATVGYIYLRFAAEWGSPAVDPWVWLGVAIAAFSSHQYLGQHGKEVEKADDDQDAKSRHNTPHPLASALLAATYLAPLAALAFGTVGGPVAGPVWAAVAIFYLAVGMRHAEPFITLLSPASILILGCLPRLADHSLALTQAAFVGSLIIVGIGWMIELWRSRLERFAFAGIAILMGSYLYIRLAIGVGSTHWDPWIIHGFAALFLALDAIFEQKILKRAILTGGALFPAIALAVAALAPGVDTAYLWSVGSLIYILFGWKLRKKGMYIPAIILLDIELFLRWFDLGLSSPIFFALPAGLSCLGIARLYRRELPDWGRSAFRLVGLAAIYLPSMVEVFAFDSAWSVLAAVVASILGIAAGIGLQVRSYLFAGASALVLSVGINLFRVGLQDRIIGSVLLFIVGVSVLSAGVIYSAKTERIKRRYNIIKDALSDWD